MPELPEVESVRRSLLPKLVGRRITQVETSGKKLRRAVDRTRMRRALVGATVEDVRRVGKYLLITLSNQNVLLVHLGMTGWLIFRAVGAPLDAHTHARFILDADMELRYVDPRRFGILRVFPAKELARSPELAVLGLDPLAPEFTAEHLAGLLASAKRDLKGFLLDQSRIAGVGNIYASEALFLAGLKPQRRTQRVGKSQATALHDAILKVLKQAIENRGTSFSDYVDAEGEAGNNQNALSVYGRQGEACPRCGHVIRRLVQGARSTFYCPACQR
jgi:formamidopyrimidine-DNA glycosylase